MLLPDALAARLAQVRSVTPEQIAAWQRDPGRLAAEAWRAEHPEEPSELVTFDDGIAILSIRGGLTASDDFWSMLFGDVSYALVERDLRLCLARKPRAIVLDWSSPGGDAEGPPELSRLVYESRGKVPIKSLVRGGAYCASAAYYVGSAADEVVIAESGIIGSIGTIIEFTDWTEFDAKAGIKTITIRSSQSPDKRLDPATAAGRESWQARLDAITDVFGADVARNRGTTPAEVFRRYGKGDVLVGADAVRAGLADRIGTIDDIKASLIGRRTIFPSARASATEEPTMKCESCGADPMRCADCGEEAKAAAAALGLQPGATTAQRHDRARALTRLESATLTATGAKSIDEAIGALAALEDKAKCLAALEAEQAQAAAAQVARDWRELLKTNATGAAPKLTHAMLARTVPAFLDGDRQARAREAAAGVLAQPSANTTDALIAALSCEGITAAEVARLRGFVESLGPAVPAPTGEKPIDLAAGPRATSTTATSQFAEAAKQWGIKTIPTGGVQ